MRRRGPSPVNMSNTLHSLIVNFLSSNEYEHRFDHREFGYLWRSYCHSRLTGEIFLADTKECDAFVRVSDDSHNWLPINVDTFDAFMVFYRKSDAFDRKHPL